MEVLEDRTALSPVLGETPVVAAKQQQAVAALGAVENAVNGLRTTAVREIAQVEVYFEELATNLYNDISGLLITFIASPNPPSGSNTATTASNAVPQQPNVALQQTGSGAAATAPDNPPPEGTIKPMAGGGGGGTTGSTATVSGQVWLDNNADGDEDDGESGYSGVTVELETSAGGVVATTTTNASGNYSFTVSGQSSTPQYYQIQVIFPQLFFATTEDPESEINSGGYSAVFALTAGATQNIPAGMDSMNVNTNQDDANGAIPMKVTLRDAIDAGNKGDGPAVTFASKVSGNISLQAALPAIQKSYNIEGTGGATNLTVNGNSKVGTIFTVNAGVTSTISNLVIVGGLTQGGGGGILNNGNLTLHGDNLTGNQAADGGGIYNASGAQLQLQTVDLYLNNATASGGGLFNDGTVKICCGSDVNLNHSVTGGGGIYNVRGKIAVYDNTLIEYNWDDGFNGGGVDNISGTFTMLTGSIFDNQEVSGDGGGVADSNGASMTLTGVAILGNDAKTDGGGLYVNGGTLTLKDGVTISPDPTGLKNVASNGGGMYVNGGTVMMSGGAIDSNRATNTGAGGALNAGGGGLFINGGSVTLTNVGISFNESMCNGGAAYVNRVDAILKLNKDFIGHNETLINNGGNGGGVYISKGDVTADGGTLEDNYAPFGDGRGGGIYNNAGSLTLANGVNIFQNTAKNDGGGMYLADDSTTTFNGVDVSGNQATTGPGVFEQSAAKVKSIGAGLTDNDDPGGVPYNSGIA